MVVHRASFVVSGLVMRAGIASLLGLMRAFDPAGAYVRYAAYVTLLVCLTGAAGYALTAIFADATQAQYGGVFPGLVTGIALMLAKPDATRRSAGAVFTIGGAIAICAGLNSFVAPYPALAQPLLVAVAFAGFYVRRWPEPWPSAGLLGLIALLIHQIIAQYASPTVMRLAIVPAVLGVAAGYAFMPRTIFSRGLLAAVQRLRAGVNAALRLHLDTVDEARASIQQIDALLDDVNRAREQADRFNAAAMDRHLALVHKAAVVARVWENAAEYLQESSKGGTEIPEDIHSAARDARSSVANALANPSSAGRIQAQQTLERFDQAITASIGDAPAADGDADFGETALFDMLNIELTLSHLIDSATALDQEIATWAEPAT
jgi:hypothetical protein